MRAATLLMVLLSLPAPLMAQQRSLFWNDFAVDATLDANGTLHVEERQTIVFTGDWNGGERRFNIRPRQRFEFIGMRRVDPATGATRALDEGDLSRVDGYDFTDRYTLRWRSRMPGDPAFSADTITYVLEYALSGILQESDSGYMLAHDFAFPDRDGVIERFSVNLALDASWQPAPGFRAREEATNLLPGRGYVVRVPLTWAGQGEPAVIDSGASPGSRWLLAATFLAALLALALRLLSREKSLGRLEPLGATMTIDSGWLRDNVFAHLPEVVGAAWDNRTDASEVTAVLARSRGGGPSQERGQQRQGAVPVSGDATRTAGRPESFPRARAHAHRRAVRPGRPNYGHREHPGALQEHRLRSRVEDQAGRDGSGPGHDRQ
jgi:hypothetical protein